MLPIVNENGDVIGSALRSLCHDGKSMLLHPVVHLHIVNGSGKIMLQKRASTKKIQPGKWDTCVGGHISYGEDHAEALRRETYEETGMHLDACEHLTDYVFQSSLERERISVNLLRVDDNFSLKVCNDEVDEVRFWSYEEINDSRNNELFTPNFLLEYNTIVRESL